MPAARQRTGITTAQTRMLHAARRTLGMDDPTWRGLLDRVAGVRSSTELTNQSFDLVVRELERAGFVNTARAGPFGARAGFATPPQIALIKRLAGELWGENANKALATWLRRFHHVDHLRFVDFDQAPAVIEGLKAQLARQPRELSEAPPPA